MSNTLGIGITNWEHVKQNLLGRWPFLTDSDIGYKAGEEDEMIKRIIARVSQYTANADGTFRNADGTLHNAQFTARNADGSLKNPDGTVRNDDGTFKYPDGTVVRNPDGTVRNPDGTFRNEYVESIINCVREATK
jgi:hypothetical protein